MKSKKRDVIIIYRRKRLMAVIDYKLRQMIWHGEKTPQHMHSRDITKEMRLGIN
jgi:hypothetical protein